MISSPPCNEGLVVGDSEFAFLGEIGIISLLGSMCKSHILFELNIGELLLLLSRRHDEKLINGKAVVNKEKAVVDVPFINLQHLFSLFSSLPLDSDFTTDKVGLGSKNWLITR